MSWKGRITYNTSTHGTGKKEDLAKGDKVETVNGTLESWQVIISWEDRTRKIIPENRGSRNERV